MIIKNGKTILFASLIVAMVLPFSGMEFAQAEMSDSKKERLISTLEKLDMKIENAKSDAIKERLEAKQQAILEKLYEDTDLEKLSQAKIDKTVDSKTSRTSSSTLFNIYGTHSGCDNGVEIFNFKGDYVSGATQLTITQSFLNELTSGDSPNCEEHAWKDNVFISITNIWDNSGCVGNMDVDPIETYNINCATLGGVYVVKVTADYDGEQTGSYSWFWA